MKNIFLMFNRAASVGCQGKVLTRGRWAWDRLSRAMGMALNAGVQGASGQHSQRYDLIFGWSSVEPVWVGLDDLCGSLST